MTAPTFAAVLEVHHHDDRVTQYEAVRYWPWRDGVTVYDVSGREIASHSDVLRTEAA